MLDDPSLNGLRVDGVMADLRAQELPPEWQKFLATCTLCHIPVYHSRQITESISGRVQIDRLSENEFGSLLPPLFYVGFKRVMDFLCAVVLLPFLLPVLLFFALLIKRDSLGPVFFYAATCGLPWTLVQYV
ncbi:sugar transferase [Halomonas sp. hl-4]|uniref:sugar transferase n=1 Tax=Halomonas sp. hl-4 TaxID=1761789 RepID=UPI0018D5A80E|nr:sugar transferase [Halomonas sp. hl-4]